MLISAGEANAKSKERERIDYNYNFETARCYSFNVAAKL